MQDDDEEEERKAILLASGGTEGSKPLGARAAAAAARRTSIAAAANAAIEAESEPLAASLSGRARRRQTVSPNRVLTSSEPIVSAVITIPEVPKETGRRRRVSASQSSAGVENTADSSEVGKSMKRVRGAPGAKITNDEKPCDPDLHSAAAQVEKSGKTRARKSAAAPVPALETDLPSALVVPVIPIAPADASITIGKRKRGVTAADAVAVECVAQSAAKAVTTDSIRLNYESMKVADLRSLLQARSLSTTGVKAVLISRLLEQTQIETDEVTPVVPQELPLPIPMATLVVKSQKKGPKSPSPPVPKEVVELAPAADMPSRRGGGRSKVEPAAAAPQAIPESTVSVPPPGRRRGGSAAAPVAVTEEPSEQLAVDVLPQKQPRRCSDAAGGPRSSHTQVEAPVAPKPGGVGSRRGTVKTPVILESEPRVSRRSSRI